MFFASSFARRGATLQAACRPPRRGRTGWPPGGTGRSAERGGRPGSISSRQLAEGRVPGAGVGVEHILDPSDDAREPRHHGPDHLGPFGHRDVKNEIIVSQFVNLYMVKL